MTCPFCTSEYIVPKSLLHGEPRWHCMNCGEDFMPDTDAPPADFDPAEIYDACREEGHDWQEVFLAGESIAQCRVCGAIDA